MIGSPKILIVDDDPLLRDVLSQIMQALGYQFELATDGGEGIRKVKNGDFDVIFTDIRMPKMDGMEFIRQVKAIAPLTPVAIITGYPSLDVAIDAIKEGARDFITKPFNSDQIRETVERLTRERWLLRGLKTVSADSEDKDIYRELIKRLEEIAMLQALSVELDELYNNNDIYDRIVQMIARLLTAQEAYFGIINDDDIQIKSSTVDIKGSISVDEIHLHKVITKQTHCIVEAGNKNPFTGTALQTDLLILPLITGGEVFGILGVTNKVASTKFSEDEVYLAITFAKKVSLRIENNTLYEIFYTTLINTLKSLVISIEARDPYTKHHSERVTRYALEICEVMGLSNAEKETIQFGGYLHDIGKIGVRDTVLLKPSRLTEEEMKEIKRHPVIGESIVRPLKMFNTERDLILLHHERVDGRGYPTGATGGEIPLLVKILTVADTYDAMTSTRPYRPALSHQTAVEELLRCSGTQFDPEVVKAFLQTPTGRGAKNEQL